jgi:MOSC domain-containing protein YiiM
MIAEILSMNISGLQTMRWNGEEILTGINKSAVDHPVQVGTLSIVGDVQADLVNHGGRDKAVYFYPSEHFPFWAGVLGKPHLEPGSLGENFTTKGIAETEVFIGDIWRVGTALVQITSLAALAINWRSSMNVPTLCRGSWRQRNLASMLLYCGRALYRPET